MKLRKGSSEAASGQFDLGKAPENEASLVPPDSDLRNLPETRTCREEQVERRRCGMKDARAFIATRAKTMGALFSV